LKANEKKWNIASLTEEQTAIAKELSEKLDLPRLAGIALVNRGYLDETSALEFIKNDTIILNDPFLLPDMEEACEIIIDSMRNGERICVYGDYDVDGVTATSLVYSYLKDKGADITHYIPDRKTEGYGMNMTSVERIAADGVKLIITVDNGITAVDEIAYARGMGLKVVITDHHSCHEVIPDADAAVNPKIPGCEYPYTELAGVGVAFKTVCAIETLLCEEEGRSVQDAIRALCIRYSEIVTIGTVADVMPLRGENRLLCAMGMYCIDERPSVAIDALMYMASLGDTVSASAEYYMNKPRETRKRKATSSYIGFVLAPRINAAGRVTHANDALKLLLAEDKKQAAEAAYALCGINNARKAMESAIFEDAVRVIESKLFDRNKIIVLDSDEWQHGVIGIVASRILERYGRPVILISFEDGMTDDDPHPMDVGKGSCRSVKGFDIHKALDSCSDLFVRYGGHELAAGLTIYRKDMEEFVRRISEYAEETFSDEASVVSVDIDCKAELYELTLECSKALSSFEPYGTDNEQPRFCTEDAYVKRVIAISGGKYSKLILEKDGEEVSALCFSCGPDSLPVFEGEYADVAYYLETNEYKGVCSVQLNLEDIRLAENYRRKSERKSADFDKLLAGEDVHFEDEICPQRKEFVVLYSYLRKMYAKGFLTISLRRTSSMIKSEQGVKLSTLSIELMLNAFAELGLMGISKILDDIYDISFPEESKKVDLSSSELLDRYRKACASE